MREKVRLQKAVEQLVCVSSKSKVNSDASVTIADSIPVNPDDAVLKGHGTADSTENSLPPSAASSSESTSSSMSAHCAPASSYKPEVGDIVIGRVIERWRTAVDELNMRGIFEEKDVICAEVRGFQNDGLHLQARSQKYGKLNRGQLLEILPYLVKRQKQHFHHLEQYGVDLILGCNGFVWVGEHIEARDDMIEDQVNQSDPQVLWPNKNSTSLKEQEKNYTALETRKYMCRAANAVRVLSTVGFNITLEIIKGIIDLSLSLNLDVHEMLGSEFCVLVAEREAERRSSNKKKR